MQRQTVSCDLHDYFEIACLFNLEVTLSLHTGNCLTGRPITTSIDHLGEECLAFRPIGSDQELQVPMIAIARMQATQTNAHFSLVEFP